MLQRKVWSAPDVRVYDKSTKLPRWTKLVVVELNELYKMIISRQQLSNDPSKALLREDIFDDFSRTETMQGKDLASERSGKSADLYLAKRVGWELLTAPLLQSPQPCRRAPSRVVYAISKSSPLSKARESLLLG